METGIHTFEAFIKIRKGSFDLLFDRFNHYAKDNKCRLIRYPINEKWEELKSTDEANKRTFTLYLNEKGINISLLKIYYSNIQNEKTKCKNYYLRYIITPYHLLNGTHYHIYTKDSFAEVCDRVNEIALNISESLIPMQSMRIRRIDFCRDLFLDNAYKVRLYIDLLKQYALYKGYKIRYDTDKDGLDYPHEVCTALVNDDIEFCAYDKHYEMASKPNTYTGDEITAHLFCLRLELRMDRDKIYNLRRSAGINDNIDFLNYAITKSHEYIGYYLKKLFHKGNYYSYEKAIEIIDNEAPTQAKTKLKELIYCVSKHNGLQNGIIEMRKKYSKRKVNNMLEQLNELKVNPITISRRKRIEYSIGYLDNLLNDFGFVLDLLPLSKQ